METIAIIIILIALAMTVFDFIGGLLRGESFNQSLERMSKEYNEELKEKHDKDIAEYNRCGSPIDRNRGIDELDSEPQTYLITDQWMLAEDKEIYLKSSKWRALRRKRLEIDNNTCQSCKSSSVSLEIHHITYRNLGNEKISDLISICRECHQKIHDKYGYNRDGKYPINQVLFSSFFSHRKLQS